MQSTDTPFSPSQKQLPLDADLHYVVKEIRESFLSFLDRSEPFPIANPAQKQADSARDRA